MAFDEAIIYLSATELCGLKMMPNKVLVEVFDNRAKVGEIVVPITSENPFIPDRGVIFKTNSDSLFELGEYVVIEKYKGKRVLSGDRQFILLDEAYVLAKVE